MIKPLLTLTCTSEGAGSHEASDSEFNSGKAAYEQLLHKEDLHYVSRPDPAKLEVIAPYKAIESAVVTRSSETVEDPVDSLCKSENDEPEQCENIVISIAPQDAIVDNQPVSFYQHDDVAISGNVISGTLTCPYSPTWRMLVLDVSGCVVPEGFDIAFFNGPHYDFDHMLSWISGGDNIAVGTVVRETEERVESLGIGFVNWDEDPETYSDCVSLYDLNLTYDPCGD